MATKHIPRETFLGKFRERRERMRELFRQGMSKSAIGRRFHLSRERVRQIVESEN